jgi:ParB-like chromosome segregation protein Spo0J
VSKLRKQYAMPSVAIADVRVPDSRKRALSEAKVKRLADSIAEVDLLNPITITPDNVLISGWHRLEACRLLGRERITVNVVVTDDLRRELAEIDENLIRNELTQLERSEQLQRRMDIYEALHPETKHGATGGGRGGKGSRTKTQVAESATPVPAFAEATAEATGKSARVIREDVQIAKALDEDERDAIRGTDLENSKTDLLWLAREKDKGKRVQIAEKVKTGAAKTAKDAARLIRNEERAAEREKAIASATDEPDKWCKGDVCRIEDLDLPENSVDMVFTDPPYHDEHIDLLGHLARVAARALKPGGLCLVYVGHMYLPQVIQQLTDHLDYVWQFVVFHPFSQTRCHSRAIFVNYRSILAFRKLGKIPHASKQPWVQDVVRGRRDKDEHDWQQDEDAPRQYIEAYTKPGATVLDPFSGGGTTAAVCKALGRKCLYFDIEENAIATTRARVQKIKECAA